MSTRTGRPGDLDERIVGELLGGRDVVERVVRGQRSQGAEVDSPVDLGRKRERVPLVHAGLVALMFDARVVWIADQRLDRRRQGRYRRGRPVARPLGLAGKAAG